MVGDPSRGLAGVVLLVDDDDDFRDALEQVLRATGYEVVTARDGAEALSWLKRLAPPPCVVLLDLMMPGMNGFELRSAMAADPQLAGIPVVVITGAGVLAEQRAAELQAEVLPKPIELPTLLGTVRRFCYGSAEQAP